MEKRGGSKVAAGVFRKHLQAISLGSHSLDRLQLLVLATAGHSNQSSLACLPLPHITPASLRLHVSQLTEVLENLGALQVLNYSGRGLREEALLNPAFAAAAISAVEDLVNLVPQNSLDTAQAARAARVAK